MHISQFFFSRGVAAAVLGHSQNENSGDENFRMLYTMSENSKDNFYEKTFFAILRTIQFKFLYYSWRFLDFFQKI